MKQVSNVIAGEYLIYESGEYLKKAQYIKCFKLLNRAVIDPTYFRLPQVDCQIQIQICRRLIYSSNQLIGKYFRKQSEKSHKIQPLLNRVVELCQFTQKFLTQFKNSNALELVSDRDSNTDSPTSKRKQMFREYSSLQQGIKLSSMDMNDFPDEIEIKSQVWFQNQCYYYFLNLSETLINCYKYEKFMRNQGAFLYLQALHKLINKNKYDYLKLQEIKSRCYIILGNAYFELNEFKQAESAYEQAIDLSKQGMGNILLDIERLKISVNDKRVQHNITKFVSYIIISLELTAMLNIQSENYHRAIECYHLTDHVMKTLGFFSKYSELRDYINKRSKETSDRYTKYIQESVDIAKLLNFLYPSPQVVVEEPKKLHVPQSLYEKYQDQVFEKMKYDSQRQFIIKKGSDLPPMPISQQKHYFIKGQNQGTSQKVIKHKQNNSQVSIDQPSTMLAESQAYSTAKNDVSISKHEDTSFRSTSQKQLRRSNHSQSKSYLSELIKLRNDSINRPGKEQQAEQLSAIEQDYLEKKSYLEKIDNSRQFIPLDKLMVNYIETNLQSYQKVQSLTEIKSNATTIIKAENEVHKELPITKSLINARKMTSSKGVVLIDTEQDFNKHFEFNAIEYFDFVTSNKQNAINTIRASQEKEHVKRAQQSLFSENFVPKKKIGFQTIEEKQKQIENNRIDLEAQKLLQQSKGNSKSPQKQQQLKLFSFLQTQTTVDDEKEQKKEVDLEKLLINAQGSIKNRLNQIETQSKALEDEDLELRNVKFIYNQNGYPFKFRRAKSIKFNRNPEFKSILKQQNLYELGTSTKNIREKDHSNMINENRLIQWAQKDKSK